MNGRLTAMENCTSSFNDRGEGDYLHKINEEVLNANLNLSESFISDVITVMTNRPLKKKSLLTRFFNAIISRIHEQHKDNLKIEEFAEKMNEYIIQEKGEMIKKDIEHLKIHLTHLASVKRANKLKKEESESVSTIALPESHEEKNCVQNKWNERSSDATTLMTNSVLYPAIIIEKHNEVNNHKVVYNRHCLYGKVADAIVSSIPKINRTDVQFISNLLQKHIKRANNPHPYRTFNAVIPEMPNWALRGYMEEDFWNKTTNIVGNLINKLADYIIYEKSQVLHSDIEEFCAELIKRIKCKSILTNKNLKINVGKISQPPKDYAINISHITINPTKSYDESDIDEELDSNNYKASQNVYDKNRRCIDEAIENGIKTLEYIKQLGEQMYNTNKTTDKQIRMLGICDEYTDTSTLEVITNNFKNKLQKQTQLSQQTSTNFQTQSSLNIKYTPSIEQHTVNAGTYIKQDITEKFVRIHYLTKNRNTKIPSLITKHCKSTVRSAKIIPMCKKNVEDIPLIDNTEKESIRELSLKTEDSRPLTTAGSKDKISTSHVCTKETHLTTAFTSNSKRVTSGNYNKLEKPTTNVKSQSTLTQNVKPPLPRSFYKYSAQPPNKYVGKLSTISKTQINPLSTISKSQINPLSTTSKLQINPLSTISKLQINQHPNNKQSCNETTELKSTIKRESNKSLKEKDVKRITKPGTHSKLTENKTKNNKSETLKKDENLMVSGQLSENKATLTTHISQLKFQEEEDELNNSETSNISVKDGQMPCLFKTCKTYSILKPFQKDQLELEESNDQMSTKLQEKKLSLPSSLEISNNIAKTTPDTSNIPDSKCFVSKIPVTKQTNNTQQKSNLVLKKKSIRSKMAQGRFRNRHN